MLLLSLEEHRHLPQLFIWIGTQLHQAVSIKSLYIILIGGSAITGYKIYKFDGSNYSLLASVGTSPTSYQDPNTASSGLTYNYKISCINTYGEGVLSSAVGILAASVPD
jgi:hypothetical protein